MNRLRKILDRYYRDYDFSGRMGSDPVSFPRRYHDPRDVEVAGFISAAFAYGRVELFMPVVDRILSVMGKSPAAFLMDADLRSLRRSFSGIAYRFNENDDVVALLYIFREILRTRGSLERAFKEHYREEDEDIGGGLSGLMNAFLRVDAAKVYGKKSKPAGLLQFFPLPERGSACKRANLFLRWMVRDRDTDLGIWRDVPKDKLIIPLDTHIARIAACLGLTHRKTQDWKMAVEITRALRRLDADDPLKYDFALCHHGISGLCAGGRAQGCRGCLLKLPGAATPSPA